MKFSTIILLLLVACTAPQLEAEKPTLPDNSANRVVDIQEAPSKLSAQEKLDALFTLPPPKEFTITINIQSRMNNTVFTETVTQFVAQEQFRTSTKKNIEGRTVRFDTFFVNEQLVSCVKDKGWVCEKVPENPDTVPENPPAASEPVIIQLPSRLVAGFSTQCFALRYPESNEELCLTDTGLIAYRALSSGDEYIKEELIQYRSQVPKDIFVLPQ